MPQQRRMPRGIRMPSRMSVRQAPPYPMRARVSPRPQPVQRIGRRQLAPARPVARARRPASIPRLMGYFSRGY